jgi:hypothetical protein
VQRDVLAGTRAEQQSDSAAAAPGDGRQLAGPAANGLAALAVGKARPRLSHIRGRERALASLDTARRSKKDGRQLGLGCGVTDGCRGPSIIEKDYGLPPGRCSSWTTAAAASSRRPGENYALRAPQPARKGRGWPRCGRRCTSTSASRCRRPGRSAQALSPARVAAQSRAMAKAGPNKHIHGCPRKMGPAVLRSRESP